MGTLSIKEEAEDEKPEQDCEGGVGVSKSPVTVAPGKKGRKWFVHNTIKCWEEDEEVRAANNLLDWHLKERQ